MKPLNQDMLSLLIAVVVAISLLWGSDALTQWLAQKPQATYAAAFAHLLPVNVAEVFALITFTLLIILLCTVLSF